MGPTILFTFKNYFATVFSVFSNNKFNPNTLNIYIYIYIYYKHAALNKENLEEHTQKKKTQIGRASCRERV